VVRGIGQVVLDFFLENAGLDFLGHGAQGPVLEAKFQKEKRDDVVPEDCCPQCYFANGPVCRCSCRGRYHGIGAKLSRLDEYVGYEAVVDEAILKSFEDANCLSCGESLRRAPVLGYEHPDGAVVDGRKLWVFAVCSRCGYQNSLDKIMAHVSRVRGVE